MAAGQPETVVEKRTTARAALFIAAVLIVLFCLLGLALTFGTRAVTASDHTALIYSTSRRDEEIFTVDTQRSIRHNLTNWAGWDGAPARSPDNSRIAFTSLRDGNQEIYVMNADGSQIHRLTDNPGRDVDPVWSPDGARIAFVSDRSGDWNIHVMNADGTDQRQITELGFNTGSPAWSPDSDEIVFVTWHRGNWVIFLMDADGNQLREATPYVNARSIDPVFSPDGQRIAFASDREDGNFEIYIMDSDGGNIQRVTHDAAMDANPAWHASGDALWFVSWREGFQAIYQLQLATGAVQRVTNDGERASSPS